MKWPLLGKPAPRETTPVLPPGTPWIVDVAAALLVGLIGLACFGPPRMLCLVHGAVFGMLVYLSRQAWSLWRMRQDLQHNPLAPDRWAYRAFSDAVLRISMGWRTTRDDVHVAMESQRARCSQQLAVRWWCCLMISFGLPLVGLLLGWGNVGRTGDLLPRNVLFTPLTISWCEASIVVMLTCALFALGERILSDWLKIMSAHADPKSELIQGILAERDTPGGETEVTVAARPAVPPAASGDDREIPVTTAPDADSPLAPIETENVEDAVTVGTDQNAAGLPTSSEPLEETQAAMPPPAVNHAALLERMKKHEK